MTPSTRRTYYCIPYMLKDVRSLKSNDEIEIHSESGVHCKCLQIDDSCDWKERAVVNRADLIHDETSDVEMGR